MSKSAFEVYTYFGRSIARFEIGENETHHCAAENARQALLKNERNGVICWIRFVN